MPHTRHPMLNFFAGSTRSDAVPSRPVSRLASRRVVLKHSAAGAAALAFAGATLGIALRPARAVAQSGGGAPGALQLALKLEYLEAAFYAAGYARFANGAGDVTDTSQQFSPGEDAVVAAIAAHEAAHVALLTAALGAGAGAPAAYDFSGGSGDGTGPFVNAVGTADTASKDDFFKLAQLLEDLGVRAYKGQLGNFVGAAGVDAALRIHTVEARHAAMIRTLRNVGITAGTSGGYTVGYDQDFNPIAIAPWPAYSSRTAGLYDPGFTTDAGENGQSQADLAALVYGPATPVANNVQAPSAGEDNLVQRSSQATTALRAVGVLSASANAEAFDEPMDASAVLRVAALFGVA